MTNFGVQLAKRLIVLGLICSQLGQAQVTTTGDIRGKVLDPSGAPMAGVELKMVDMATRAEKSATSAGDGGFVFRSLSSGAYQVTATGKGFETTVLSDIKVETARTSDVTIRMSLGAVNQKVEVQDTAVALETSSSTISSTVRNESIQQLPVSGRNILGFALLTAGAQRGATDRNSNFNGLPNASLNITLDGINNNDWRFKSGGTSNFVFAPLRLGAIEEVTVSTAGMGSDSAGSGAMQMRWVTKRGTNTFHGSGFYQSLNDAFNANTWFSNANGVKRPVLRHNEFGGNFGGPLWKNKIFFFVNYEHVLQPAQTAASDTVLTPAAQQGIFSYSATDGTTRNVNLLQLAGNAGFPSRVNPIIAGQLQRMNTAATYGVLAPQDLIRQTLLFNRRGGSNDITEKYPTARADYQITPGLAFNTSWNLRWRNLNPSPTWPGPGFSPQSGFRSTYFIIATGLSWTISPTLLNEFRIGFQGDPENYNYNENIGQFDVGGVLRQINYPLGIPLLTRNTLTSPDNNPVFNISDNLSWVKGKHTISFGGSFLRASMWDANAGGGNSGGNPPGVQQLTLGVASSDPITSVLSSAALPGIRTTDLSNAWALYALLTGRLSGIANTQAVNENTKQYQALVPFVKREDLFTAGGYVQDSWRFRSNLTLNFGLRLEFTGDEHSTNGIYTSPTEADLLGPSTGLFQPGVLNGVANPQIYQRNGTYNPDYKNVAPNFGFAWNPQYDSGFLGKLFGGKTVIRGGVSVNYYQEGTMTFENYSGLNPGFVQTAFLNPGQPGFAPGGLSVGDTIPGLSTVPASFSPPFPQSLFTFSGNALGTTAQNLHQPYVTNWTFGIQREVYKGAVVEVRYVGNKGTHVWHGYNENEVNIVENGFGQQFAGAQTNLAINQAAGITSFANTGRAGQVATPIFDRAFGALGSQAALAASQGYGNGSFITLLQQGQAGAMAASLAGTSTYLCRMVGNTLSPCAGLGYNAAGQYPINFFQPNPYAAGAALNYLTDTSYTNYNGLQIEARKKFGALTMSTSYTFAKSLTDLFVESPTAFINYTTLRNKTLDKGPNTFDIRHAFNGYVNYALPFGNGHMLHGNGIVNRVIGGWSVSSIFRVQSGLPFKLISGRETFNQNDAGVTLNGITTGQLQDMFLSRSGPSKNIAYFPQSLIGSDGRANPSVIGTPTTPGQLGSNIFLHGFRQVTTDISVHKAISLREPVQAELAVDALNAFNHPLFLIGSCTSFVTICSSAQGAQVNINATTFGQTSAIGVNPRNLQMRLSIRF